jgi:hypothetical protein
VARRKPSDGEDRLQATLTIYILFLDTSRFSNEKERLKTLRRLLCFAESGASLHIAGCAFGIELRYENVRLGVTDRYESDTGSELRGCYLFDVADDNGCSVCGRNRDNAIVRRELF